MSSKNAVLVMFYTTTCPSCAAMKSVFEELSDEFIDDVKFARVNVEQEAMLAQQFGIMGVPTFKFFCKGTAVSELTGQIYPALLRRSVEDMLEHGGECATKQTKVSWDVSPYA